MPTEHSLSTEFVVLDLTLTWYPLVVPQSNSKFVKIEGEGSPHLKLTPV